MAAVYPGLGGEGKQMLPDTAHELAHAAARKIGAPHAACKQDVSNEEFIIAGQVVGCAVSSMTRYRKNLPFQPTPIGLSWGGTQYLIHHIRLHRREPPGSCGFFQRQLFAVWRDGMDCAACLAFKLGSSLHVVKMLVREQEVCQPGACRQLAGYPPGHTQRSIYRHIAISGFNEIAVASHRTTCINLYLPAHARIVHAFGVLGEPKVRQ